MNSDIKFYWSLLLRRLPVMVVLFVVASSIGIGLAVTLPSKYVADAKLLVESPQIPGNLAASTVQTAASEQLQVIEQRLKTRANLIDLANRFRIFQGRGRMSPDEIVREMRANVRIWSTGGANRATLMTIAFTSENPQTSADVVNELVTLVLNEDVRFRTARAEETLEFFEDEVDRLSTELARRSASIVEFKSANKDALPAGQGFRLDRQRQVQDGINLGLRDRAALNEQRNRLVTMFENTGQVVTPQAELTPNQRQLQAAQDELGNALTVYSETNPRVKILQARIERLEQLVSEEVAPQTASSEGPSTSILDLQLEEIDSRIGQIDEAIQSGEAELEQLRVAIEQTPENAIRLEALEREYENVQAQYDRATSRLATAQTGERIEVLSKGARMTVLEQATAPTEPTSPNRKVIAGGGVAFGGGLAVAFFLLLELVNRSIRRPNDLVKSLNIQPLATIPYLETAGKKRRRRAFQTLLALLIVTGIPAALWAIHEYYLPLDLVLDKVLNRLGL